MKKLSCLLMLFALAFASCSKEESDNLSSNTIPGQNGGNGNQTGNGNTDSVIPDDMEVAFPDPIFRDYVLKYFDKDGDGKISKTEALAVTEIWPYNSLYIESLEGIQYFTNLQELTCYSNLLTTLDISKNTELTTLSCAHNQLKTLDVSKNTKLKTLECDHNQLTTLDLSKNTALTYLSCTDNQLTALDVSNHTALEYLYCSSNQLKSLNVYNCIALTSLSCSDNKLTTLDVSRCKVLTYLTCYSNQIEELDLSGRSFYITDNNTFYCAPMNTLKKVYLKNGSIILGITDNRSSEYIPDHTEIIFVD